MTIKVQAGTLTFVQKADWFAGFPTTYHATIGSPDSLSVPRCLSVSVVGFVWLPLLASEAKRRGCTG